MSRALEWQLRFQGKHPVGFQRREYLRPTGQRIDQRASGVSE